MIDRDIQGMPSQGMPPMQLRAVGLRGGRQAALASTSAPFTRFFLVQEIHRGAEDGPKFERARCGGDDRRAPKPPHTSDGAHAPPQTSPRPTAARWQNSQPPHHSLSTPLTPLRSRHTRVSTVVVRVTQRSCVSSQSQRPVTRTAARRRSALRTAQFSPHAATRSVSVHVACCGTVELTEFMMFRVTHCLLLYRVHRVRSTDAAGAGRDTRQGSGLARRRATHSRVSTHTTAGPWPRVLLPPPLAVRSRVRALISKAHTPDTLVSHGHAHMTVDGNHPPYSSRTLHAQCRSAARALGTRAAERSPAERKIHVRCP